MLDEKNDGKMSKYKNRCENGGRLHTFDEYGLCFECNKTREDAMSEDIKDFFKDVFKAEAVSLSFDAEGFLLKGIIEIVSIGGHTIHLGLLEKENG